MSWLRQEPKKRSNTSLEKFDESERSLERLPSKILLKSCFLNGKPLNFRNRKTFEDQELDFNWSNATSSKATSQIFYDESMDCFDLDGGSINLETMSFTGSDQNPRKYGKDPQDESFFSEGNNNKPSPSIIDIRFLSTHSFEVELGQMINKPEDTVTINDFLFIKLISKGAFGRVWLVKRKLTGEYYAMKIINFADKLTNNHLTMLKNENDIFKLLKGDMFVNAIFTFSHENFICFVMEYMYGGDLGALLHKEVYFTENIAKYYIAEIILAVDSLHKIGIIHRDLKPDNVLIDSQGHLKLTDFGLSDLGVLIQKKLYTKGETEGYFGKKGMNFCDKQWDLSFTNLAILESEASFTNFDGEKSKVYDNVDNFGNSKNLENARIFGNSKNFETSMVFENTKNFENSMIFDKSKNFIGSKCKIVEIADDKKSKRITGTPDYMSPEVIDGVLLMDRAVDWWSCGVILFEFLAGIPPFNAETPEKIFENIKGNLVPWQQINIGYEEGSITPVAKDLINKLLDPDYRQRFGRKGVKEIQQHRFFKGFLMVFFLKEFFFHVFFL